jgi:hypothetical protein
MIEYIIIISLIVQSIWYSMQEGEIFGGLGEWLRRHLPGRLHSPVFDCPVCMTPWYGLGLLVIWFFIVGAGPEVKLWPFVLIAAMGVNVVISKLERHDSQ